MFERFFRRWRADPAEKTVLGVKVRIELVQGQWYAMFRAWDRGHTDEQDRLVPERVAIAGVDPSDALKRARDYLGSVRAQCSGDLILARETPFDESGIPRSDGPIRQVYIYPDGLCVVFDSEGTQLTQYQGPWDDVAFRLMRDAPDDSEFHVAFPPALSELRAASRAWKIHSRVESGTTGR